jgi:hypothetical protein
MTYYYIYMGLLIVALVLWAVVALYDGGDDGPPTDRK